MRQPSLPVRIPWGPDLPYQEGKGKERGEEREKEAVHIVLIKSKNDGKGDAISSNPVSVLSSID